MHNIPTRLRAHRSWEWEWWSSWCGMDESSLK